MIDHDNDVADVYDDGIDDGVVNDDDDDDD